VGRFIVIGPSQKQVASAGCFGGAAPLPAAGARVTASAARATPATPANRALPLRARIDAKVTAALGARAGSGGLPTRIICGPGRDRVTGAKGDRVAKSCEKVSR
jgi:hypothetical protein